MRTYYLQTLEGAPRLGQTREELETYFDVCLEAHSEDPTNWGERIYSALVDVAEKYGVDNVPVVFWHIRDTMGRTGYYAVDLWNERNPEQVEPEPEEPGEVQQQTEEGNTMTEDEELNYLQFQEKTPTAQNSTDITLETQMITPGADWTLIDDAGETLCYEDENGGLHYIKKKKSGLGWLIAAAAAFFLLG